ncbi:MAG: 1,2-phenylacetyl-CoA epoxidase subunit B [Bacteroidia bacterium]|nr:1,2-phenylacetyl-CoA epoxidase subunit B [Bacteroidia bacterium]MCX7652037.1 1,2-phenylacetyl-CoA epoxidase subunit B [Bacteroidia bacterium]MDW8416292.1 1,2-phenylacetyl-CoA epoxidase subunit PaaB [Bacteroidia bacterium]
MSSLDPRIRRAEPDLWRFSTRPLEPLEHWQTYEVFTLRTRGGHAQHVGSLHAPNDEMALILAKEQYARRSPCVALWVVPTAAILWTRPEEEDIFQPATDKSYREPQGYLHTRERIEKYRDRLKPANP